jgi:hypothetical protein
LQEIARWKRLVAAEWAKSRNKIWASSVSSANESQQGAGSTVVVMVKDPFIQERYRMGGHAAATGEYPRERLTKRQIGNVELLTSKACVFKARNIPHPPDASGNGLKVQVTIGIARRRSKEQIAIKTVSRLFRLVTDEESMPGYYRDVGPRKPSHCSSTPSQAYQATDQQEID